MITHCPSCELSFRVSDSQLAAAGGLVRCGACLKVFNANDHLDSHHLDSKQQEQERAAPTPDKPPQSPPPPPPLALADGDDFFIDDNFDLALLDRLTGTDSTDQDSPGTAQLNPQRELQQEPQQAEEANPMDGKHDSAPSEVSPTPDSPADAERESAPAPRPSVSVGPSLKARVSQLTAPTFDADHFAGQDSERVTSLRSWLWYPLLLMGIVALPLQYAHFHADILGQEPRWRPFMERLCQATRCSLAPLANRGLIATTNLVVRSHPDQAGALRVDATLINRATFVQPFPHLILSFTNLEGDLVASRNFAPGEYLGGELKGAALMPVQQPVKLELDILDPGPEAVSYSLTAAD